MSKYILAIDQGTTSTAAILIDTYGNWISSSYAEFPQVFSQSGWVEHSPIEIWKSVKKSVIAVLSRSRIDPKSIVAVGLTNQRETTVAWNCHSDKPICNAIVWQCRRSTKICENLVREDEGIVPFLHQKTGLILDPYFSATKMAWILKNIKSARELLKKNQLRVATVDSFLLWRLTNGLSFKTDVSNASRTMLMNLKSLDWDAELLNLFHIPEQILPEIHESTHVFGVTKKLGFLPDGIPITGIMGDQQSALFGQACFLPGSVKCTFGTGSFILLNTGSKPIFSKHKMLTTVAWKIGGKTAYAIEGGAFNCGAAIQWLRDGLGLIKSSQEIEKLARTVKASFGVEFIPALTGLGAPYWRPNVRGAILGLSRGTSQGHIARAALEGLALQNTDIIESMEKDYGRKIRAVNVDGGGSSNALLMQIQADYLNKQIIRPKIQETTAFGAALAAGLGFGIWSSINDLRGIWEKEDEFSPRLNTKSRKKRIHQWHYAIDKLT